MYSYVIWLVRQTNYYCDWVYRQLNMIKVITIMTKNNHISNNHISSRSFIFDKNMQIIQFFSF